jgi:hypothetical protein
MPLAVAGYVLSKSHFPPYGALAGLALGIAVWQYLSLERRVDRGSHVPVGVAERPH